MVKGRFWAKAVAAITGRSKSSKRRFMAAERLMQNSECRMQNCSASNSAFCILHSAFDRIPPMALLDGKTGIIFGVANKRSIAWAIAQALAGEGMRLAFTYQGERLKEGVETLTSTMPEALLLPCDVTVDGEIDAVFAEVGEKFGRLDALVNSVAFAPREDMENDFYKTSRDGFKMAHDISAFSLVGLTRAALPLFEKSGGGAVLAMSYYGAVKAVEGYNVMGVAKSSLEASVRYLAANLGPKNV